MYTETEEKYFSPFALFVLPCVGEVEEFQITFQVHGIFTRAGEFWSQKLNGPWKFSSTPFQPILHYQTFFIFLLPNKWHSNYTSPRSKGDSYIIWIEAGTDKNQTWSIAKLKKQKIKSNTGQKIRVHITVNILD